MGGFAPQIGTSQTSVHPQGKGAMPTNSFTNSATSGQPQVGMPNQYSYTVGTADNMGQQPQGQGQVGKGKG